MHWRMNMVKNLPKHCEDCDFYNTEKDECMMSTKPNPDECEIFKDG